MFCTYTEGQNKNKKQFVYTTCTELAVFLYNLSLYCGFVDARISASDKDLPVSLVSSGICELELTYM